MEQKTTTKLTIGSFFVIFLIVIYFGNLGSTKVNKKLDLTNQKIEKLITQMHEIKSKLDELEKGSLVSESNDTQQLSISTPQKQISSNTIYEDEAQIENPQPENKIENSLVDVPVVEKERVECCEMDEWAEIQKQRIPDIIDEIVSRENASISTENIHCEPNTCSIDLNVVGENGMLLIQTIIEDLNDGKSQQTSIRSINRNENEFGVVLELNKIKEP